MNTQDFQRALDMGRPPNIRRLFPNSRALIVSGKIIDRALMKKGASMTIAANARNYFVLKGTLQAAQKANACVIIEIARSEGGTNAYCAMNYWNLATMVDTLCNQMGITVPVAVHADHYKIKSRDDVQRAKLEIPTMFDAGITSIAIDASHMSDDENLLANIELRPYFPLWAGYETEVGEIKGKLGLSTPEEAEFLIKGLNAHGIFPDWLAVNNGTTHGIESTDAGIQVELTVKIHEAIKEFGVSGAQHGTSGNSADRLRRIAKETRTTKANVATALQMISWGVRVNQYGNAELDDQGQFIKEPEKGMSDELWAEMVSYARSNNFAPGDYKKLNLPFENRLLSQPREIRERMAKGVEEFVLWLLKDVFYADDTAPLAIETILESGSFHPGDKCRQMEDPGEWTEPKIRERAKGISTDKGPSGDFDD